MSTRANVIFQDEFNEKLYFYRHSDGYPEHTLEDLKDFVKGYADGSMRLNSSQSAGWLIMRGNAEYKKGSSPDKENNYDGWKVGAYEPASQSSADIEYLYVIDLKKRNLKAYEVEYVKENGQSYGVASEKATLQNEPIEVYEF